MNQIGKSRIPPVPRFGGKLREGLPSQTVYHEDTIAPADLMLAKRVTDVLMRHYPGHPWAVTVQHAQGVVIIKIPLLTDASGASALGNTHGMVLHIDKLDPALNKVVRAGGELLERWNIDRTAYSKRAYRESRPVFNDLRLPGAASAPALVGPDGLPLRAA